MRYSYLKPRLKDLSQGSRIAFIRRFRGLTQDEVSSKLSVTENSKRRTMARYESGIRNPKEDRLTEIASILNVNADSIRQYDFKNTLDIVYILMWLEELYPRYRIDLPVTYYDNDCLVINKFMKEWNEMRIARTNKKITYEEYIEWKLNYEIKREEK